MLTPEQHVVGLTDFGPGRSKLFGNSADAYLKVHYRGASFADVTEGSGGIWERPRYDWSDPNRVVLTTTDSNVWGGASGHTYTFTRHSNGTTEIDADVIREYLDFRDKWQMPIWLGESGENDDKWIAAFTKTLEENHVGWCFWPYKKMDAASSPVTFDRPAGWDAIIALSKMPGGTGNAEKRIAARPSPEDAQKAFDDLLKKITFTSERVNADYVTALGRKAP